MKDPFAERTAVVVLIGPFAERTEVQRRERKRRVDRDANIVTSNEVSDKAVSAATQK